MHFYPSRDYPTPSNRPAPEFYLPVPPRRRENRQKSSADLPWHVGPALERPQRKSQYRAHARHCNHHRSHYRNNHSYGREHCEHIHSRNPSRNSSYFSSSSSASNSSSRARVCSPIRYRDPGLLNYPRPCKLPIVLIPLKRY